MEIKSYSANILDLVKELTVKDPRDFNKARIKELYEKATSGFSKEDLKEFNEMFFSLVNIRLAKLQREINATISDLKIGTDEVQF